MTFIKQYALFVTAELCIGSTLFAALTAQAMETTGLPWQFFMPW